MISRIELGKTKQYFITAFKLADGHIFASLICVVVITASGVLQYVVPPAILIASSVSATLISRIVVGSVLKKYYGEEALNG